MPAQDQNLPIKPPETYEEKAERRSEAEFAERSGHSADTPATQKVTVPTPQATSTQSPIPREHPSDSQFVHNGPVRDRQLPPNQKDPTKQTNFREFDGVIVKQVKADAKAKQQSVQTQHKTQPNSLPPVPQAKPNPRHPIMVAPSTQAARATTISKKQAAAGAAINFIAGSMNSLKEGFTRASQPIPTDNSGWQMRLGKGFLAWGEIRASIYGDELDKLKTIEEFDSWLKAHPDANIDGRQLTLADWKHREDYYEYDRLLKEENERAHQEHKEQVHKGEHLKVGILHDHANHQEEHSAEIKPQENPKPTTSSNVYTPPKTQVTEPAFVEPPSPYYKYQQSQQARYKSLGVDSRPVFANQAGNGFNAFDTKVGLIKRSVPPPPVYAATPDYEESDSPVSSPRGDQGGGGIPSLPRLRGLGLGGRGGGGFVKSAASVAKVARFINPWTVGIILGCVVILILFVLLESGGDAQPTISKQTTDTTVENSDCSTTNAVVDTSLTVGLPGFIKSGLGLLGKNLNCSKLSSTIDTGKTLDQSHTLAQGDTTAVLGTSDHKAVLAFGISPQQELNAWLDKIKKNTITYNITASYPGQADDIKVTDSFDPTKGLFLQASGICHLTYDSSGDVTAVWWSVKENQGVDQSQFSDCGKVLPQAPIPTPTPESNKGVRGASTTAINFSTYTQSPYNLPTPNGSSDVQYPSTLISAMNMEAGYVAKHQSYLVSKTGNAKYVDPFLSVIWTGAVEQVGANPSYWSNGNPYFWNCLDNGDHNISDGCPTRGFTPGGWQVGYGMQVSQATSHIAEDFDEVYGAGSSNNAQKVQQVGQAVINNSPQKITNPSTFPAQSLQTLAQAATQGDQNAQQAIAVLLLDKELGAVVMAREIAGDISTRNNWSSTMSGWGSYYSSNLQNFSNRAQSLAQNYTGTVTDNSTAPQATSPNASFAPITFYDKVLPLVRNDLYTSLPATVEVIGGRGGSGSTSASLTNTTTTPIPGSSNTTPNTSNCNGAYTLNGGQHDGKNFGDPNCDLAQSPRTSYDFQGRHWTDVPQALVDLLKQLDPNDVGYWIGISSCEAPGFDPNNVSVAVNGSAYGLFQMGASYVGGQESPFSSGNGLNGQYDRGDVNWQTQVSNAVNYHLKVLNGGWGYWECARIVWGF